MAYVLGKTGEFFALVRSCKKQYPEWRMGQLYFNVLYRMNPMLAEEVRCTEADPFYQDEKLPAFFDYIIPRIGVDKREDRLREALKILDTVGKE